MHSREPGVVARRAGPAVDAEAGLFALVQSFGLKELDSFGEILQSRRSWEFDEKMRMRLTSQWCM
jgi:hypothetical protein